MCFTGQQIIDHVNAFAKKYGENRSSWYVGVSPDPEEKLFSQHCVKKNDHLHLWIKALSSVEAHKARLRLVIFGFDSGPCDGGGEELSVYVYRKTCATTEP